MNIRNKTARLAAGAALAGAALAASSTALACDTSVAYTGSICVVATSYCPNGTAEAAGQILPITQYQALYSLLGTTYGGDGYTTFGLPDLRGRIPVGHGQGPGLEAITMGQKRGTDEITLPAAALPAHTHTADFTPNGSGGGLSVEVSVSNNTATTVNDPDSSHRFLAGGPAGGGAQAYIWSETMDQATSIAGVSLDGLQGGGTVTVDPAGGGQPRSHTSPQLGMLYCIVLNGIYPNRP